MRRVSSGVSSYLLLAGARDLELALLLQGERAGRRGSGCPERTMPRPLAWSTHVERLIPRDVPHADRDVAGHVVGGDDVHAADVREEAEDVVDVGVLEVEVDAAAGVAARLGVERGA